MRILVVVLILVFATAGAAYWFSKHGGLPTGSLTHIPGVQTAYVLAQDCPAGTVITEAILKEVVAARKIQGGAKPLAKKELLNGVLGISLSVGHPVQPSDLMGKIDPSAWAATVFSWRCVWWHAGNLQAGQPAAGNATVDIATRQEGRWVPIIREARILDARPRFTETRGGESTASQGLLIEMSMTDGAMLAGLVKQPGDSSVAIVPAGSKPPVTVSHQAQPPIRISPVDINSIDKTGGIKITQVFPVPDTEQNATGAASTGSQTNTAQSGASQGQQQAANAGQKNIQQGQNKGKPGGETHAIWVLVKQAVEVYTGSTKKVEEVPVGYKKVMVPGASTP